jgi:hypothetical protein
MWGNVRRRLKDLEIHGQRLNFRGIKLFNLCLRAQLAIRNQIDACALATISTRAANTMNLIFTLDGQFVINNN